MCPRLKLSAGTERLYNARHRCCGSKSCATENRFRNSRFAPCESHGPGEHVRLVRQKHTRCCNVLCATARLPASTWTYTSSIIAVHPVTMHSRESDSAAGLKPQITGERPFELIYKRGVFNFARRYCPSNRENGPVSIRHGMPAKLPINRRV